MLRGMLRVRVIAPVLALPLLLSLGSASAPAQTVTAFTEINPRRSNHPGDIWFPKGDPDAATGGRVNNIAADPANDRVIYAASEWGGLWKSTDRGSTWRHLDGHVPQAMSDVEVDPTNPSRIYATSLFDGKVSSQSGIAISLDGGETWSTPAGAQVPEMCDSTSTQIQGFGIAIDQEKPSRLAIGTSCGVALSTDHGASWRIVDAMSNAWETAGMPDVAAPLGEPDYEPSPIIYDVVIHNGGTIDACGEEGHFRSIDGGTTWRTADADAIVPLPRGRCSITAAPGERDTVFAVSGTRIFDSTNGGRSWSTRYANPIRQGRIPFVTTNPREGGRYDLWFGDVSLHRRSCQAGAGDEQRCPGGPYAWEDGKLVPAANGDIEDENKKKWRWKGGFTRDYGGHDDLGDIAFSSGPGRCPIAYSSDGGVYINTKVKAPECHTPAWRQPDETPRTLWNFDMAAVEDKATRKVALYFGNQDNGTFGTLDAGAPVVEWNNQSCCDGFSMAAELSRVVGIMCFPCRLQVSKPGLKGQDFEYISPPRGALRGWEQFDSLATFGPSSYVVVTQDRTFVEGETLKFEKGGVFVTRDIAANPAKWSELGESTLPEAPCGVHFGFKAATPVFFVMGPDPEIEYRGGCSGEQGRFLWRYAGAGAGGTWQRVLGPDKASGFGIYAVDPGDADRIIGADVLSESLVISGDGGRTWQRMPELESMMTAQGKVTFTVYGGPVGTADGKSPFDAYRQPTLLAFDPENPAVIVAGAADAGLFISIDGGIRWTLLTDPFNPKASGRPHIPRPRYVHFQHLDSKRLRLFIGSQGRGVWRIDLDGVPLPARHAIAADKLFESGSTKLKATAADTLGVIASSARGKPNALLYVDGHTDSQGADADNQKLSEKRASAVRAWLTSAGGLPKDGVRVRAYGEARPAASNGTAAGRAKNRRVEIQISEGRQAMLPR